MTTKQRQPEPRLELALPAEPASIPLVRRAVSRQLREWDLGDLVDAVALASSELATNAVLHARGSLRVTLERSGDGARLEVTDDSTRLPHQRRHSELSGTGRGLQLVGALAVEWGVDTLADRGKVVWAVFSLGAAVGRGDDPPAGWTDF